MVPEVREDFCGFITASDSGVIVSGHSMEVAHSWDLPRCALVVCGGGGMGTHAGQSIHETGVPVCRSLQYAGAPRVVMPIGSRCPADKRVTTAAAAGALLTIGRNNGDKDAASGGGGGGGGGCVADAMQAERIRCIKAGVPLADWAVYSLCGLP